MLGGLSQGTCQRQGHLALCGWEFAHSGFQVCLLLKNLVFVIVLFKLNCLDVAKDLNSFVNLAAE